MLDRLVKQRRAVSTALIELNSTIDLTPADWQLAASITEVLAPITEATKFMSKEVNVSISSHHPLLNALKNKHLPVSDNVQLFVTNLINMK